MRSSVHSFKWHLAGVVWLSGLVSRLAHADDAALVYIDANPSGGPNTVSAFVSTADGHASPVAGAPFATGGNGLAVVAGAEFAHRIEAVHSRNLLFAANDGSGTVAVFNVNAITGVLSAVLGSPFRVGAGTPFSGISLAASTDGRFLYASASTVVSFFVDDNGGLNEIGSRWAFPQRVAGIGVDADNTRLFLSTPTGVTILHTAEGGLTADPPTILSIGSVPMDLRLDPIGNHVWVGTQNGGITAYSYDRASTTLVPGAPFFVSSPNLSGLVVDGTGGSLFAYSPTGPRLLGAQINLDGSLTLGQGSPLSPSVAPRGAALSPDGHRLLLADGLGQLDVWATSSSGSLAHLNGYPILSGALPGFPSVTTLPKANPVPAVPRLLVVALAAVLLLVGLGRMRSIGRVGRRLRV